MMLWIALFSLFSSAFEIAPEQTYFSTEESFNFDRPGWVTGEYLSDVHAFKRTLNDPAQRWTLNNHYDLVVGSLSSNEFLTQHKVFFRHFLVPNLEFRFLWFQDRDYEQDHSILNMEVIYWLLGDWGLAINGAPDYNKSENNIGAALVHRNFLGGESRLFIHRPQIQRNVRTRGTDRWNKTPIALGFSTKSSSHEFVFRYERPTELSLPDEERVYQFRRTVIQAKKWLEITDKDTLASFVFYEKKWEGQEPTPTGSAPAQLQSRQRFTWQNEWFRKVNGQEFTLGLVYNYRHFTTVFERWTLDNWLPYAWWSTAWAPHSGWSHRWRFGVDSSFHNTSPLPAFVIDSLETHRIDARANIAFEAAREEHWNLSFLFTFDVDRQKSDTAWEGGAAQFRLFF